MIVVVASPMHSGFSYTIAQAGGKPTTTDFNWEAVEVLRELGVTNPSPVLSEAETLGAAILPEPLPSVPTARRNQAWTVSKGEPPHPAAA